MKILILGGYGVFGGRLAQLLRDEPRATLLIAGRNAAKARGFCESFDGAATALPAPLDRADIARGLSQWHPNLVVDASGPFQDYGAQRYRVIEACIAAGCDYLDFADAADFVFGVDRYDAAAKQAGVFVLSGVSSFPVLTAAVLRALSRDMTIERVEGGIAPSPYAGIGLNVMRAVVGYAGAPVKLVRGGRPSHGIGLAESRRYTIAPPGQLPLRNIHFSLVDVPDLQVLPPEHIEMTDIWMGAGPVPEVLHRALNLLAKARHRFRLPSLEPLSPLFYRVLNLLKLGEHRGGMYVHAHGHRDGSRIERSWHLLAEGDDGPFIPSMAVEGIVRKLLAGERPEAGARAATRALELEDYDDLFAGRAITTGFREHGGAVSLYRQLLGSAFDTLPSQVQALHDSAAERVWKGSAKVTRGHGLLAGLVARTFGFPRSAGEVAVSVHFKPEANGELWSRDFGGQRFSSYQSAGTGRNTHLLVERFGAVRIALALVVDGERLKLIPRRWSFVGIPMPKALLPRGESFETQTGGQFTFDVTITLPLIGHVVRYCGTLAPV
ncbi:DUF4166 domain-containing protein [Altererythrobacter sp. CAU 1778]